MSFLERYNLTIGKLYSIEIPRAITPAGREALIAFLAENQLPALPEDWNWEWLVTKGEYAGTFPKRLSSYFYKRHQLRIDPTLLSVIGNLVREHTEDRGRYYLDFDDQLNWCAGQFGDSGSCFWGGRREARRIMRDNGGLAVRFYKTRNDQDLAEAKYDDVVGVGRAWAAPDFPKEDCLTLFNSYGYPHGLLAISRILATWLGLSYYRVNLCNWGDTSGVLYINSGGYTVAPLEVGTFKDANLDLRWNRTGIANCDDIEGDYQCDNCGDFYEEEDGEEWGDDWYCWDCLNSFTFRCERCDGRFNDHEAYNVHYRSSWSGRVDIENWCPECWEDDAFICARCGESWYADLSTTAPDGDEYCPECAERVLATCQRCGECVYQEDVYEAPDGDQYCIECAEQVLAICQRCGECVRQEDAFEGPDGEPYCEGCYEIAVEEVES